MDEGVRTVSGAGSPPGSGRDSTPSADPVSVEARAPRERSWLEIRWRQFRHAPTPVWRAVVADAAVATVGGVLLLGYDLALDHRVSLPGGDLRTLAASLFVLLVVTVGTVATYLWVPLPSGAGTRRQRTAWSGMLGFFASLPVAYLVLVLLFQVLRPLLG